MKNYVLDLCLGFACFLLYFLLYFPRLFHPGDPVILWGWDKSGQPAAAHCFVQKHVFGLFALLFLEMFYVC